MVPWFGLQCVCMCVVFPYDTHLCVRFLNYAYSKLIIKVLAILMAFIVTCNYTQFSVALLLMKHNLSLHLVE